MVLKAAGLQGWLEKQHQVKLSVAMLFENTVHFSLRTPPFQTPAAKERCLDKHPFALGGSGQGLRLSLVLDTFLPLEWFRRWCGLGVGSGGRWGGE